MLHLLLLCCSIFKDCKYLVIYGACPACLYKIKIQNLGSEPTISLHWSYVSYWSYNNYLLSLNSTKQEAFQETTNTESNAFKIEKHKPGFLFDFQN